MTTATCSPVASDDAGTLIESLTELYSAYVKYQNLKDMTRLLSCVHENSVWRPTIQKMFEPQFDNFTLAKEVQSSVYGGCDGEFAYFRFNQTVKRVAGPEFRNTRTENLVIFRREGGGWKIWNSIPLWIEAI
jgi:hypothetical protein